jgi:hypothetical protein
MPVNQYENLIARRLADLKNAGTAPVEAIKTLHLEFGLSLAEAKQAFARSPAWTFEVAGGDALHTEIMQSDDDSTAASKG